MIELIKDNNIQSFDDSFGRVFAMLDPKKFCEC